MDFSVNVLFADQPAGVNSKRAVVVALHELIEFKLQFVRIVVVVSQFLVIEFKQFLKFKQFVLVQRDRTQPESQLDRGRPGDSPQSGAAL